MDFETTLRVLTELAGAIWVTLALAAATLPLGFVLAALATWARASRHRVARMIAVAYVTAFRSTPLLVQIFVLYYGLSQFAWLRESPAWIVLKDPFACAVVAMSLCTGAYTAEVMRGGLAAVPKGAVEAARALGLSPLKVLFLVTVPIAVRRALPAYSNEIVVTLKATSLASTITVMELTGVAKDLMSQTFAVIEVFCMVAAIYLAINTILIMLLRALELRLTPLHERPKPQRTARVARPNAAL
ncbi:ABC transporter permease [Nitratireductor pacificus]|uniref:Octopine transport system permease protein n=1 Tax=Nitratireductor pacificus pht-3B TaxID=391937 RepID=K2MEN6_9HYPH|nr:ABC transporter permease subunit [Nitratireductor pacificus]EKF19155.1 octopine transport system permease protein [Nitratireductor pacificus pht-3B]